MARSTLPSFHKYRLLPLSDQGLWGIRARFDASGRRLGAVERFDRRPADAPALLRLLLRATFLPGN